MALTRPCSKDVLSEQLFKIETPISVNIIEEKNQKWYHDLHFTNQEKNNKEEFAYQYYFTQINHANFLNNNVDLHDTYHLDESFS